MCSSDLSGRLRVLPDFRQILFCRILRDVPVVVDKTEETKDFSAVRPELVPLPGGNRQEISLFDRDIPKYPTEEDLAEIRKNPEAAAFLDGTLKD